MRFDYKPTDGKFLDILIEWGGGIKKWVTNVSKIEITGKDPLEKRYLVTFTDHLGRQCETSVPLRSVAEVSFFEKDTPSSQELTPVGIWKNEDF